MGINNKEDIVKSFKYLVCVSVITFFTTLILLGCDTQRFTTKFELTPTMEDSLTQRFTTKFELTPTMEDSLTTPESLTKELEEELKLEDAKRIKMLQEKEQEKKEKEGKPAEKKVEETKGGESKIKP